MSESSHEFRPDLAREIEYLLGQMPRVDRETFQGLLIENGEVSDRVAEAENELFDAYVRGQLPGQWRLAFEERLLSTPEGKRKLVIARKLMEKSTPAKRTMWFVGAIAAAIALIAGLWPSTQRDRSPDSTAPPVEIAQRIETLELRAVTRGEANRPKFTVTSAATQIELAGTQAASLELSTLDGQRPIWKSSAPPPFRVPATLVPAGKYLVTAFDNAGQPSNYYEFEVVRE
jgi:anti-sigma-K factor RskA